MESHLYYNYYSGQILACEFRNPRAWAESKSSKSRTRISPQAQSLTGIPHCSTTELRPSQNRYHSRSGTLILAATPVETVRLKVVLGVAVSLGAEVVVVGSPVGLGPSSSQVEAVTIS
jgi:hypothetical protein